MFKVIKDDDRTYRFSTGFGYGLVLGIIIGILLALVGFFVAFIVTETFLDIFVKNYIIDNFNGASPPFSKSSLEESQS